MRQHPSGVFKKTLWALVACCIALPPAATAQSRRDGDEEGENKPPPELELRLPGSPKAGNLLAFEPSAASTNRFFIDAESIYIGDDGIVRYTLVVTSASGASNTSYEGMRCDTQEQKTYAIGRSDGTWTQVRRSEWRKIVYKEFNRQHGVLYAAYFCPDGSPVKSAAEAVRRFKYGVPYGEPPRSGSVR